MAKTFEEVPVATVEVIPTFDGNEIKFKPSSKLGSYLIAEGEVELYLKPQHQPLPVVSKDVAEWIEILKSKGLKPLKNPETYGETGFTEEKLQNIVFWISEHQEDYMRAWLDGYTVEKPQLFYLKNKMTNSYLCQYPSDKSFYHLSVDDDRASKLVTKYTQEEIESMQTGSYELVPVEDAE